MVSLKTVPGAAVLVLLAGCGADPDPIYAQAVGYRCANSNGRVADNLCRVRPAGTQGEVASRYCYKTIGDANCFDRPDDMSKNQELGSSGY